MQSVIDMSEVPMVKYRNVFYRKSSKKTMQIHMVFPEIWCGKELPQAGDVLFPGLSSNKQFKSFTTKEIEQYCIKNNLRCYYSKGELEFSK